MHNYRAKLISDSQSPNSILSILINPLNIFLIYAIFHAQPQKKMQQNLVKTMSRLRHGNKKMQLCICAILPWQKNQKSQKIVLRNHSSVMVTMCIFHPQNSSKEL